MERVEVLVENAKKERYVFQYWNRVNSGVERYPTSTELEELKKFIIDWDNIMLNINNNIPNVLPQLPTVLTKYVALNYALG